MPTEEIKIFQLNIQSFEKNKEELTRALIIENYNVVLLSETWSKIELESSKYSVPGFFTFLDSRDDGYGGAGILINKKLKSRGITLPNLPKIQAVARLIVAHDIVVMSVYAAPNISHFALKQGVESLLQAVRGYRKVLVGGDFNAHHSAWDPRHQDNKGAALFDLINDEAYILLNEGQMTFVPVELNKSPSAIDLVLVSPGLFDDARMKVLNYGIGSRHLAIETVVQLAQRRPNGYFINKTKVAEEFSKISVYEVVSYSDLQGQSKIISKKAKQPDKHVPKFWWSDEVELAWNEKNEARTRFNRSGDLESLLDLRKKETIFKRKKQESSRKRFEEFVASFDPRTPAKTIWNQLGKLTGKKKKRENVLVHDDLQMAQQFLNKYFPFETNIAPIPSYLPNYDILTSSFWIRFLSKKSSHSAPGPDGIAYSSLKLLNAEVRDSIIMDMNHIWRSGVVPENLKSIKVVAIPKPGKDPESIEGVRPLSMLNCGMKILNAAVLEKLQQHIEIRNILPRLSFGFRKGMSTVGCLEYVTNKLFLAKREKNLAAIIFVDLSNAFNAIKLDKLEQCMLSFGLPPEFPSWVLAFLADRKIQLQVGADTLTRHVSQGLPQGDILSPTLFNIYTANLHSIRVEGVELVQYADDFAVMIEGRDLEEINERGNQFMERFVEAADELNFTINAQKTKAILFLNSPKVLNIHIGTDVIETVNFHKYLGLLIDRSLRFGAHLRDLSKQAADRLNVLKVISGTKYGSHPATLGMAYNAFFRGFIEYGSSIYSSACKTNLERIDVINNACLRRITGCTKTTPRNTLQAIAAQPPLQFRRLKVVGKQVVKHYYRKTPVWEQINNCDVLDESKRYTYIEQIAAQHAEIFQDMTCAVSATPLSGSVDISTTLNEELWPKKQTNIRVLRQLTLSLIHGKYRNRPIIYTDASSNGMECGIGVFHEPSNTRLSLKLSNFVCIMSAEIQAIFIALQYINRNGISNGVIMTDSRVGCEFILDQMDKKVRDYLINQILVLAAATMTSIQWIPGHTGVRGNEMADQLAKQALEGDIICTNKILLHDAVWYFQRRSEEDAQQWYLDYSSELGKGRKYFQIQNTIPHRPWHFKLDLNNKEVRTLNRLLSGHDFSRYWLFKMKLADDCICESCDVTEDAEHIIFYCVKYAATRNKYGLDNFCNIYNVWDRKNIDLLRDVVSFLKEINSKI